MCLIHFISKTNNTPLDNEKGIHAEILMFNLTDCTDNDEATSESVWQYYKDDPNDKITDSKSSNLKSRLTNNNNTGISNVEMTVPLKYLSTFRRTIEMPIINCKINLMFTWLVNCVICESDRERIFAIIDRKSYVPVVILPTQGKRKLFKQWKWGFKGTINWNKDQ